MAPDGQRPRSLICLYMMPMPADSPCLFLLTCQSHFIQVLKSIELMFVFVPVYMLVPRVLIPRYPLGPKLCVTSSEKLFLTTPNWISSSTLCALTESQSVHFQRYHNCSYVTASGVHRQSMSATKASTMSVLLYFSHLVPNQYLRID